MRLFDTETQDGRKLTVDLDSIVAINGGDVFLKSWSLKVSPERADELRDAWKLKAYDVAKNDC